MSAPFNWSLDALRQLKPSQRGIQRVLELPWHVGGSEGGTRAMVMRHALAR